MRHAGHERAFDDLERARRFLPRLLGIGLDVIDDALDQRVGEPLLDRRAPPLLHP